MTGCSDPARNAALKCIPCNAPIIEIPDGRYACIECGEVRIERRSPSFADGGGENRAERSIAGIDESPQDDTGRPVFVAGTARTAEEFTRGGARSTGRTTWVGSPPEVGSPHEVNGGTTVATTSAPRRRPARETTVTVDDGPTVLAAVPAYNEAGTIAQVVRGARAVADDVLVVDDGSDDGTTTAAERAGATVVEHRRNRGYGAALKTIFREGWARDADCLVVLDGDRQHDPGEIPKLLEAHRATGAEIVIGSRFADGSETKLPAYRRFGILVINVLTNLSMGVVRPRSFVKDTQSGFRLYSERAMEELAREDGIGDLMDASVDILLFAHQRNYLIEEVGATVDYEVDDANSYNPVVHGYQLVRNILTTIERERPILSLGIPGLFASVGGVGFALLTFRDYLDTGTLSPYFVTVAIFVTLFGLLSCFTAVVLHALHTYFRSGF